MFCEKCGNRLEPGDVFCPECGTKVSAAPAAPQTPPQGYANYQQPNNSAWQVPAKKSGFPGAGGSLAGGLSGAMSGGAQDLALPILGVLYLISTFLPLINIDLGKLGELASMFGGPDLSNLKFNIYQLRSTLSSLIALDGDEEAKWVITVLTLLVIYVVAVAVMAIVSGVFKTKGLLMTSGIMSAVCLLIWIVYVIVVAHYKSVLLDYIASDIGYDASGMMPGIHGIGLFLMIITLGAHSFLAIRKAVQM